MKNAKNNRIGKSRGTRTIATLWYSKKKLLRLPIHRLLGFCHINGKKTCEFNIGDGVKISKAGEASIFQWLLDGSFLEYTVSNKQAKILVDYLKNRKAL